jgi:plastocyanin
VPRLPRLAVLAAATFVGLTFASAAQAGIETLVFRSKPIMVQPYEASQTVQLVDSPSVNGYVTGMSADIVDENGDSVPNNHVMLHHVVFAKIGTPDYTCGGMSGVPAQRFYAEGEEHYSMALPGGVGYPNRSSDHWGMLTMLMNHHAMAMKVSVRYTVRYVTGEVLASVHPIWLDIHDCSSDPIFDVPGTGGRGSTYSRRVDLTLRDSGRLMTAGGHMHGGAIKLQLSDQTCGRSLFTSLPTWGGPIPLPLMHEPGPRHMSSFASPLGIPVAAGSTLRLTAVYDNSRPHTRVMGIMILYLQPTLVGGCEPIPALTVDLGQPGPPPRITVPLLRKPQGPLRKNIRRTWVADYAYGAERVSIKRGTTFKWNFGGGVPHDVTLASGPVGFSSPSVRTGTFSYHFTRPGTYKLFCSLHPKRMTQIVQVR